MKEYRLSYEDRAGNIISMYPPLYSREITLRYLDEWGKCAGTHRTFIEEREVSEWTRMKWEKGNG